MVCFVPSQLNSSLFSSVSDCVLLSTSRPVAQSILFCHWAHKENLSLPHLSSSLFVLALELATTTTSPVLSLAGRSPSLFPAACMCGSVQFILENITVNFYVPHWLECTLHCSSIRFRLTDSVYTFNNAGQCLTSASVQHQHTP